MNAWSPAWCLHVRGWYEDRPDPRELGPGELPEQRWGAACGQCGAEYRGVCTSGAVRSKIAKFATQHTHESPFTERKTRT